MNNVMSFYVTKKERPRGTCRSNNNVYLFFLRKIANVAILLRLHSLDPRVGQTTVCTYYCSFLLDGIVLSASFAVCRRLFMQLRKDVRYNLVLFSSYVWVCSVPFYNEDVVVKLV